jgi:hypothetical protein
MAEAREGWRRMPLFPRCPHDPWQVEAWPHVDQSVAVEPGCQIPHAASLEEHEFAQL